MPFLVAQTRELLVALLDLHPGHPPTCSLADLLLLGALGWCGNMACMAWEPARQTHSPSVCPRKAHSALCSGANLPEQRHWERAGSRCACSSRPWHSPWALSAEFICQPARFVLITWWLLQREGIAAVLGLSSCRRRRCLGAVSVRRM